MSTVNECRVIVNEKIAEDIMYMTLDFSAVDPQKIWPGRFVHIRPFNRKDLILRRPISINGYDRSNKTLELVYQLKGEGTKSMANAKTDDMLDVLGPTGNGFVMPKAAKKVWLIGGGIGCAPLKFLADRYLDKSFSTFIGFRHAACVYQQENFETLSEKTTVVTDDGSAGEKDLVTNAMTKMLSSGEKPDAIFACGPIPMLKSLKNELQNYKDIPCKVSLEERMGCGMGACYTCTCAVEQDGKKQNARVCVDGPVFDIWEVELDA